jgi:hypothetical protein
VCCYGSVTGGTPASRHVSVVSGIACLVFCVLEYMCTSASMVSVSVSQAIRQFVRQFVVVLSGRVGDERGEESLRGLLSRV